MISDRHAAPNRWTAGYLVTIGFLDYAVGADMRLTAYAALALLPTLMVELSLTLCHLSWQQRRMLHSIFLILIAICMAVGCHFAYDSSVSRAVLFVWLIVCILTTIGLWFPVLRSPVRRQKYDETTRHASLMLIVPMLPIQAFLMLHGFTSFSSTFTLTYLMMAGLSVSGFIVCRFVWPALWLKRNENVR